jgi:formate dehydrogenase iron-sulfur subunit
MKRRTFLKTCATGLSGLALGSLGHPGTVGAEGHASGSEEELLGVLVDTTRCIGCRSCELACSEINELPQPEYADYLGDDSKNDIVYEKRRLTSETRYTVVNRYKQEDGTDIFVKSQCMHCNQPGCASACLVKAMHKVEKGPVNWETNCIGCRYCMVACPFDIPKFEYNTPFPKIQKCTFCWEKRSSKGEKPACVEICPAEVMFFGTRKEVMEEARLRIYQNPETYYHGVYGEHEVGGTSWVYIGAVPFEKLGFRTDLGTTPVPKLSKGFLTNIAVIDLVVPALLLGISYATKKNNEK